MLESKPSDFFSKIYYLFNFCVCVCVCGADLEKSLGRRIILFYFA